MGVRRSKLLGPPRGPRRAAGERRRCLRKTAAAFTLVPCLSYGVQEGSFSPTNIEIENIDAGPSGSSSNNSNSNATDGHLKTSINKSDIIIAQNHLLRTLLLETMERVKDLESQMRKSTAPVPEEKQLFLNKFNYLQFPLNSMQQLKELEELKEENNFQDAVNEFASFGGSDPYNFVKRVLGSIVTTEVTIQYSWLGRRSKEAFANLRLASAVIYNYHLKRGEVVTAQRVCFYNL